MVLQDQVDLRLPSAVVQPSRLRGLEGAQCLELLHGDTSPADVLLCKVLMKMQNWPGLSAVVCCCAMASVPAIPEDPKLWLCHSPRNWKCRMTSGLIHCQSAFMSQLSTPSPAHGPACTCSLPWAAPFAHLSPLFPFLCPSPPPDSSSRTSFPGEGRARLCSQGQKFSCKETLKHRLQCSLESRSGNARGSTIGL